MNIEVEIKVKIKNFKEIKKRVSSTGKLVEAIRQIDDYYIPQQRNFFAHKPHPIEWLRIRTNPDKVFFEYTRSVNMTADGDYDYAKEYETQILNVKEFKKTLNFLDFKKVVTIDKKREYWMCGKIEVALDFIKGLGHFIEAEAKGNFKSEKEAKVACIKFLETLGIKDVKNTQIKKGYPQLLLESKKKL